jgi:TolA-binding protein
MRFTSKAQGVSDQQAEIITDIFTRTLTNSKTIALVERERLDAIAREIKLSASGLVDPSMAVELGRIAGCQYMLLGSVTELSEKASGGAIPLFGLGGAIGVGKREAMATIDMRVVDVTTSEIVLSLSEMGTSSEESTAIAIAGFAAAEAQFGGLQARAIAASASRLGHKIREELGDEYSYVVSTRGRDIHISLGGTSGVKEGDLYLVYDETGEIFDIDGTSLGQEKVYIAALKIRTVQSGYSVCDVVAEGGKAENIHRGDKIEPASSATLKAMAKRKEFVKDRPRRRLGDDLFAEGSEISRPADGVANEPFSSASSVEPASLVLEEASAPRNTVSASARGNASNPAAKVTPLQTLRTDVDTATSTSVKVIDTYPISSGEANLLRIGHTNAYNRYRSGRYKDAYPMFSKLAEDYDGNYLAAYWAGMSAQRLKKKDEAASWFDRAIAINPGYQPARSEREKIR